jgi:hypothetical protein
MSIVRAIAATIPYYNVAVFTTRSLPVRSQVPSITDFDQGGTFRTLVSTYLGPSVGWVKLPSSILPITQTGIYTLQPGVTLVTVNVAGPVQIILPSAVDPPVPAGVQPGLYGDEPITIVDIGGNATGNPIQVAAQAGQTVMGLSSVQIIINYGGITLEPNSSTAGWNSISLINP